MGLGQSLVIAAVAAAVGAGIGAGATLYANQNTIQAARDAARPGHVNFGELHPKFPLDRVPRVVRVTGTADVPDDANKRDLWIVVEFGLAAYYPQGLASIQNGHWTCKITLGSKAKSDDGAYTILAVLADAKASAAMNNYVKHQLRTSTNGMADYPADDVDNRRSISVSRRLGPVSPLTRPTPEQGC